MQPDQVKEPADPPGKVFRHVDDDGDHVAIVDERGKLRAVWWHDSEWVPVPCFFTEAVFCAWGTALAVDNAALRAELLRGGQ